MCLNLPLDENDSRCFGFHRNDAVGGMLQTLQPKHTHTVNKCPFNLIEENTSISLFKINGMVPIKESAKGSILIGLFSIS